MGKELIHIVKRGSRINTKNKNELYLWILFLIFPLSAFLLAIKNYRIKSSRKFVILFGGLYGLLYIPIPNSDATRYQSYYSSFRNYSFENYIYDITNVFSSDNLFPDIYAYTVFFIGNLFSSNPQVFHMITGLIYFFVFVKLIDCIYDKDHKILKRAYGLFFLGIVFITSFSAGINGVRWPLGVIVFLYGALNLLTQNKIRFLFIAAISILIHFSLYPIVLVLGGYYFIPFFRRINVLVAFAILTLIASSLFGALIFGNSDLLGGVIEDKLTDYTGEGYVEKRAAGQSNWNFYVPLLNFGNYFFAIGALFIMWLKQKKMKTSHTTRQLFGYAIVMAGFSFMANAVVDLSTNRYTIIVGFFTLIYLIYMGFINKGSKILKVLMYCYTPILILRIFSMIKIDSETISLELLLNPIFALLS